MRDQLQRRDSREPSEGEKCCSLYTGSLGAHCEKKEESLSSVGFPQLGSCSSRFMTILIAKWIGKQHWL
jgi:hypothetical protein